MVLRIGLPVGKIMFKVDDARFRATPFHVFPALLPAIILAGILSGCGGGGGTSPTSTRAKLTINWPARSRGTLTGLSSALSAKIVLVHAGVSGQDITFIVDRPSAAAVVSQTYTAPADAFIGTWEVQVGFYAQSEGNGDLVGSADANLTMGADGNLPDIATTGRIHSVEVGDGQSILADAQADLTFTARGEGGEVIAVTPGSAFFTVTNGADRLEFVNGFAHGLLPGMATVTAAVDGVASLPVSVKVTSNAVVAVTPAMATVSVGETVAFSATVSGARGTLVKWSLQEGSSGGTVTTENSTGVYTAPVTPGVYHLIATSLFDPDRKAVVPITVQAGGANVGADFPASGGANVGID